MYWNAEIIWQLETLVWPKQLNLKSCNNLSAGRSSISRRKNQHTNQLEFFALFNIRAHSPERAPVADKLINAQNRLQRERTRGWVWSAKMAHPSRERRGVLAVIIVTHFRLRLGVDYINDSRQLNWRVVSKLDWPSESWAGGRALSRASLLICRCIIDGEPPRAVTTGKLTAQVNYGPAGIWRAIERPSQVMVIWSARILHITHTTAKQVSRVC